MKVILGTKVGMTQIIGKDGVVTPVTIIEAGPATVTQIKTVETDGYNAVQLGFGKGKNLSKSVSGHLQKAADNLTPKVIREFRLEEVPTELKLGDTITVDNFKLGDTVLKAILEKSARSAQCIRKKSSKVSVCLVAWATIK